MTDPGTYCVPEELSSVGTVVAHSPASTGLYLGSPAIVALPNGDYLMSDDVFGPSATNDYGDLYRSRDRGRTWEHVARTGGQWWSTLFWHGDALYRMGTSRRYGGVTIRRSEDFGDTWTEPRDGCSGLLLEDGRYHCAPAPVVVHGGRLWRAMEDAVGDGGWGHHFRAFAMSAPEGVDLLRADNWTCTNRLAEDTTWLGGRFGGWLEGNAVVTPQGGIVDFLRVEVPPGPEKAALVEISVDGTRATFDAERDFVDFPGGAKKFTIHRDGDGRYWSLTNPVLEPHLREHPGKVRNALALVCSQDLHHWEMRGLVLHHPDSGFHAFQYVDWLIEGEDLIVASRTAFDDGLGGAHNQHDANFLTFHRVPDFQQPGAGARPY